MGMAMMNSESNKVPGRASENAGGADQSAGGAGRRARDHSDEELIINRRRLPHWRLKGSVYFVTWNLQRGQPDLTESERELVTDIIRFKNKERYLLFAFVVMNDHVHVVLQPQGDESLDKILHTWKSFSANQMQKLHGRKGSIWLQEGFDRIIRDENELMEKCEYVLTNPIRRWPEVRDYKWAGME